MRYVTDRLSMQTLHVHFFPYSLGEDTFYWFIHLLVSSIDSWEKLKTAFTGKYDIPTTPTKLYRQFVEVKRQGHEPISSFNNRFHKAFTRLQDPYVVSDASAREIYYSALDYLTAMFVRQTQPAPTTLIEAYAKAMEISKGLGQNIRGPLLQLGPPTMPNQIQEISQALAHQTPIMNLIPQLAYQPPQPANQLVLHPGPPISQIPPKQPVYLQNIAVSSRTQEEKDEMRELTD